MGKRKHKISSSDDGKRKGRRSSSSRTDSSSSDMEPDVKKSRRNLAEDVVSDSEKRLVNCKEKEAHKHKKRRQSTDSEERKEKKKKKKKSKKEQKKSRKHKTKKSHHRSSPECFGPLPPALSAGMSESKESERGGEAGPSDQRLMVPMTKEQWEKERNTIRHVFDPETGRNRLVRGNGEILEEIVSKKRHAEINKLATLGDGIFYQSKAGLASRSFAK